MEVRKKLLGTWIIDVHGRYFVRLATNTTKRISGIKSKTILSKVSQGYIVPDSVILKYKLFSYTLEHTDLIPNTCTEHSIFCDICNLNKFIIDELPSVYTPSTSDEDYNCEITNSNDEDYVSDYVQWEWLSDTIHHIAEHKDERYGITRILGKYIDPHVYDFFGKDAIINARKKPSDMIDILVDAGYVSIKKFYKQTDSYYQNTTGSSLGRYMLTCEDMVTNEEVGVYLSNLKDLDYLTSCISFDAFLDCTTTKKSKVLPVRYSFEKILEKKMNIYLGTPKEMMIPSSAEGGKK